MCTLWNWRFRQSFIRKRGLSSRTDIAEVMGLNPVQAWFFSGFNFTTAEVVCVNAMNSHKFKKGLSLKLSNLIDVKALDSWKFWNLTYRLRKFEVKKNLSSDGRNARITYLLSSEQTSTYDINKKTEERSVVVFFRVMILGIIPCHLSGRKLTDCFSVTIQSSHYCNVQDWFKLT